jgi:uncharacterized membrane protein
MNAPSGWRITKFCRRDDALAGLAGTIESTDSAGSRGGAHAGEFIKQTREKVTEGTSALFLLTNGVIVDKVMEALKGQTFEILSSSLPQEKEDELRAMFGAE